LILDRALLFLFAEPCVLYLALTFLDVFAFPGLQKRAGTRVNLASRKLAQHFLRTLIGRLIGLLERTVFRLLRNRFSPRLRLFRKAASRNRALSLRLNKNGFRAAMTEVLADVALLDRPLHIQRHGLATASRFIVRFFRFAHSLPWLSGGIVELPEQ
jgi:lysylphosphatidylglycerol synthetase-like protein (DUF2156 family)